MRQEIWKDIPGYEKLYQVSNLGRVKSLDRQIVSSLGKVISLSGKVLKPYRNKANKETVQLSCNGEVKVMLISRLVLLAFIGEDKDKPLAMYINGDTSDHSLENLCWATSSEVAHNAISNGVLKPESAKPVRMTKGDQVLEFDSARDAERYLECSFGRVAGVANGLTSSIFGWKVEYINSMEEQKETYRNEVWKPVIGYEGIYEVSNLGRVRGLDRLVTNAAGVVHPYKGQILKQVNSQGYRTVRLHNTDGGKRVAVHRLVAAAFIPNYFDKEEVNHINNVKHDNRVENLEWTTPLENNLHYLKYHKVR